MTFTSTGPFNAPTDAVMFVHGMLGDGKSWQPLLDVLGLPRPRCPSFPWAGTEERYWAQQMSGAEWLHDELERESSVPRVIVAHSFGCLALLEYLIQKPRLIDRIVLLSPFYRVSRDEFNWDVFLYYVDGLSELIRESIALQDRRGRYRDELLTDMVVRARQRLGIYGWSEFLRLFMTIPVWPLERILTPCLVVTGESDAYCSPMHSKQLADALPCARSVVIAGAGHFAHRTHAEQVAHHIHGFLEQRQPLLSIGDAHVS